MPIKVKTKWNGHSFTWTLQPDGWWELTHRTSAPTVKRRRRTPFFDKDTCDLVMYE